MPVVGYEGLYEVSDQGRVRSLDHTDSLGREQRGRVLKLISRGGRRNYFVVTLTDSSRHLHDYVHRLVLEAFVGPCPDGMVACHYNDIGTDNRLENLRWDTPSENTKDLVRNGRHVYAKRTHCSHGHEFTSENTRVRSDRRECLTCERIRSVKRRKERRRKTQR